MDLVAQLSTAMTNESESKETGRCALLRVLVKAMGVAIVASLRLCGEPSLRRRDRLLTFWLLPLTCRGVLPGEMSFQCVNVRWMCLHTV